MGDLTSELNELVPELSDGRENTENDQDLEETVQEEVETSEEEEVEELEELEEDTDSDDDDDDDEEEDEIEKEESSEPSALETLQAQNAQLMELLAKNTKEEETSQESELEEKPKVPTDINELFGELSFEDIMSDQELFIGFMRDFMKMATESSVERIATSMPQFVINQINQQQTLTKASNDFYTANEKLVPHKKIVGMLTNEVIAEHQDWSLDQVLEETAERSYRLLNLKQQAIDEDTSKGPKKKPALNKKTRSGKRKAPKLSKLQNEINDLL